MTVQKRKGNGNAGMAFVALCLLLALFLTACAPAPLFDGIALSTDNGTPPSHDTALREEMRLALYEILCEARVAVGGASPTTELLDELRREAEEIEEILAVGPLGEEGYSSLAELLTKEKETLALLVCGKAVAREETGALYRALRATVGRAFLGHLLYGLAVRYYTVRYEQQMALYEERGHAYLLQRAQEYLSALEILRADISPTGLAQIADLFFFFGAFLYGGALPEEGLLAFTDEELLFLVSQLDIDPDVMGTNGWSLILTAFGNTKISTANMYFSDKVTFAAAKNGDTLLLAEEMPKILSLLLRLKDRLTAEDIAPLRSGNRAAALSALFSHFGEEDWSLLSHLSALPIKADEYSRLAEGYYGEGYQAYLADHRTATLEELRTALGSDTFDKTLKGYLAGICPAFAYELMP